MTAVALRALWARKLRTLLTAFAIVLGVATVSGTYVLTHSIKHAFNTILERGRWPGQNEVVIDRGTASKKHIVIGSTIRVQAEGPAERLRVSGLVKFNAPLSIGGATLAGFDLPTAQRLFQKVGKLDDIRVAAKSGVTPAQLVRELRTVIPPSAQARTGNAEAKVQASDSNKFLTFLQDF